MSRIVPVPAPPGSRLSDYDDGANYADCFAVDLAQNVDLATFVAAFYQTPLFRAEAFVLAIFARRPSTNAEAAELAQGQRDRFAAWDVEHRSPTTLLMRDMAGRTRSWFGVEPATAGTRLLFGSVVTAVPNRKGQRTLGPLFALLLGFHKLYARALLWSAARRLTR